MPYELIDLVDLPRLQALLDALHGALGVANAVIDSRGAVIASAGWEEGSKHFPVQQAACAEGLGIGTVLAGGSAQHPPCCSAGSRAPIVVDGHHLADVLTGQVFTVPPDSGFFRRQARELGYDEAAYLEAMGRVPVMPHERVQLVTQTYALLAQMLADGMLERLSRLKAMRDLAEANRNALEERDADYRIAVETCADGYWMVDMQGRLLEVNEAYLRFSGYSRVELLQMSVADLECNEKPDEVTQHILRVAEKGYEHFETQHRARDGRIWDAEITVSFSPHAGGRMHAFIRDIRKRKSFEDELQRQAHTDFLTGVSNRRHFCERMEIELVRAGRYVTPLSILLLDIDYFKQVNDTFGHKVGDDVLQKLAAVCRAKLRNIDLIGRWGGEEFAVLMPETDAVHALEVAERLRQALAEVRLEGDVRFTVSIGCVTRLGGKETLDEMIALADGALYQAKNTGRNRVCAAGQ